MTGARLLKAAFMASLTGIAGCDQIIDADDKPDAAYLTVRNKLTTNVTTVVLLNCAATAFQHVDSLLPRERIVPETERTFRFEAPNCYDAWFLQDTAVDAGGQIKVDTLAKRVNVNVTHGDTFKITLIPATGT